MVQPAEPTQPPFRRSWSAALSAGFVVSGSIPGRASRSSGEAGEGQSGDTRDPRASAFCWLSHPPPCRYKYWETEASRGCPTALTPNSAVSPNPHPAVRNGTTHEYRTEKKGPLFLEMLEPIPASCSSLLLQHTLSPEPLLYLHTPSRQGT
uniref:Uncharacterized protein n=1 Tax=Rangifer tarandus platyrhynchus TaxID=3082113 RepID=A0ACB0E431_RANTA|nr:unnamed protein product [Rangifer tarandus platyrhynchus]